MSLRNGIFLTLTLLFCCSTPKYLKRQWTIAEVQEWYNHKYSTWDGLLYRGSDKKMHHFISRVRDEWYFFNISKSVLTLEDIRPMLKDTGAMGYYYVDPNKNFEKIKDY